MRKYRMRFAYLMGFVFAVSCSDRPSPKTSLALLNLERGSPLLCGSGQFGVVRFAQNCEPGVQADFETALALLHSFEYTEAEKYFVKVVDADPDCAMAYWGIAMSNFHPLWAPPGKAELEKGSRILDIASGVAGTELTDDYLQAIGTFFRNWEKQDHRTRLLLYEDAMKSLHAKYPADDEISVFYALAINAAADPSDKSYARQKMAGALLESLYPDQPFHPGITHYIIHTYDYPKLAGRALTTARKYASIAPSSSHAQHMPSHIFTRLGLWEESIQSNLEATASALCYSSSLGKDVHWDEELHGMDYLVYAYLQQGNTRQAEAQLAYLNAFKKITPLNFKVAYTAAAIPSRIALENRNWEAASRLSLPLASVIPWEEYPWQSSLLHFAKAMGAIRTGDPGLARTELEFIKKNRSMLLEQEDSYKVHQLEIQISSLEAWMLLAQGEEKQALNLMSQAHQMELATEKHPVSPGELLPAGELLGDMYMELGQFSEALEVYEEEMERHPNRFNGLYGAARAAVGLRQGEEALAYYKRLIANSDPGTDRREIKEAELFVQEYAEKLKI